MRAEVRIEVVPFMAGIKRSFSRSWAPIMRGEATWARCVTFLRALENAPGAVMSEMRITSRFGEGKAVLNLVAEAGLRTLVRMVGWEVWESSCWITCWATWPLPPVTKIMSEDVNTMIECL